MDVKCVGATIELKPVTRKDGGTYLCQAENSIGLSNEEPAEIDVQCEFITSLGDQDKADLRPKIEDDSFCLNIGQNVSLDHNITWSRYD